MSVSTLPADIETATVPAPRLKPTTVVARRSLTSRAWCAAPTTCLLPASR